MARDSKKWKDAQQQGNRGVHVYIGKTELKRLERDGVLDLDEDIEYSVSVGESNGRARAFIEMRNPESDE